MPQFERTESSYLEQRIRDQIRLPQVGEIVKVREHTTTDDDNNFECDVLLRGEEQQRRGALVATPGRDSMHIPSVGDIVLVNFIDGTGEAPVITNVLYTNEKRPPLAQEGMVRQRKGNLYYEAHPDGDWMRISQKSNDDDSGSAANARIEIDDSGANPVVNIETNGADININVSGGQVKLGDPNGTFAEVARKGDAVEVDDPDSGTITGTITEGSSDVQSS
ncbi:baseplate V-like protein [Halogranum tailed virus 1]|uniref:Baseplate V-like protein n=1 Tax=Halogranum tailed virus 1 TaxID=1273749 RepID=R4T6M7_9CAUD|nr:baseplate V-like protein [Halogranum tailed virus 1]AGM11354.1 baseplate V-like protein [Halogranum tailed virus 1]